MTVDEIRRPKGDFRSHRALDNILPGFQHDRPTVWSVKFLFDSTVNKGESRNQLKFNCNQGPGRPNGSFSSLGATFPFGHR